MPRRKCRKCGAKEGGAVRLQRCSLCKEAKGTNSAYYCSHACLEADWPAHKEWHEAQALQASDLAASIHGRLDGGVELAASEYERLLARARQPLEEKDAKQAAKVLKEAIALEPRDPEAHRLLGLAYGTAHDPRVVQALLDAMGLYEPDTKVWSQSATAAWGASTSEAYFKHIRPCGEFFCAKRCCAKLPVWMRDAAEMKQMADRCVAAEPDHPDARIMQARALIGLGQFEAAGGAFIQAARLCDDGPDTKAKQLQAARAAFARARCAD